MENVNNKVYSEERRIKITIDGNEIYVPKTYTVLDAAREVGADIPTLCHLKEMNHSVRFWAEVEKVMPNYREYKKWLKENGNLII